MLERIKDISGLVNEILDHLPESIWTSTTTTFLDPAIGGGQFVSEIEKRLRARGHSNDNIKRRVYGFEYNKALVELSINMNKLVGQYTKFSYENYFNLDEKKNMKFDVIVGNPPYQSSDDRQAKGNKVKGYKQPLWPLFVNKSLSLLNKDGFLAMITPTGWLAGTYDIRQGRVHLIDKFTSEFNLKFLNANSDLIRETHFPGIGSTFSWYIVQNTKYTGATDLVTEFGRSTFDFSVSKILPPTPHPLKLSIANKTLYAKNQKWGFSSVAFDQSRLNTDSKEKTEKYSFKGYCNGGQKSKTIMYSYWQKPDKYFGIKKIVLGKQDRSYYPFVDDQGLCIGSNQFWQVPLDKNDDYQNAVDVFNSKLFKFLIMQFKHGVGPETVLVYNLPKVDLSKKWTDEKLFKHFNLSQEEIEYVKANVK
jgi:site-specific DNA-methyltransferase (adenine-specific)